MKQTISSSSELKDILKKIEELSKSDDNKWQLNKEHNTASLPARNTYIFKQNNNLCLSHKGKIELFKSVQELRKWLITKATDEDSINSCYHDYDMKYISNLDLDNIDREILKSMHYYLFVPNGINHPNHIERLEKLSRGETIQSEDTILSHLDYLENNPDNVRVSTEEKPKVLSRIRQIFRKR